MLMARRTLLALTLLVFSASPLLAQLPVSTSPQNKNVVLEEFTGYKCTYCPDGHKMASNMKSNNPGDVFLVNVHAGSYAQPSTGDPDYRTSFGSDLVNQASVSGYPAGTINRHYFSSYNQDGGTAMSRGDWSDAANIILGQSAYANVALEGTVDVQTRDLTVNVEVHFTSDGAQDNNLNVALTQDSIWGPQTGANSFYPAHVNSEGEYLHMHMLRHFLTGQWGDVISNTTSGNTVSKQYTYTLPSDINGVPLEIGDLNIIAYLDTGQQEIINANDGPITYTNFKGANNAQLRKVEGPEKVCKGAYDSKITVKNMGSDPITSMTIEYDMNGGSSSTHNWSGTLDSLERTEIELPTHNFSPNSTNTFNVNITSVNGGSDVDNADNTLSKSGIQKSSNKTSGDQYVFTVVQDRYGSEITWEFINNSGTVIASGGPYQDLNSSGTETHKDTFTVSSTGCVEFKIYDAYGDGINSGFGQGSYKLETASGWTNTIFSSNGQYGSEDLDFFKVTSLSAVKERSSSNASLKLFPNPVSKKAQVEIQNAESLEGRLVVRDMMGRKVHEMEEVQLDPGTSRLSVDMSGQESGMYTLRFITEEGSLTERFSVVGR